MRLATVWLLDAANTVLAETTTDLDGNYEFSTVNAFTDVRVRVRAELVQTAGPQTWEVYVRDNTADGKGPPGFGCGSGGAIKLAAGSENPSACEAPSRRRKSSALLRDRIRLRMRACRIRSSTGWIRTSSMPADSAISKAAEELEVDRSEIQRRNLLAEGDVFPYGMRAQQGHARGMVEIAPGQAPGPGPPLRISSAGPVPGTMRRLRRHGHVC